MTNDNPSASGRSFFLQSGSSRSPDLQKKNPKFVEGYHFVTIITNQRIPLFQDKTLARAAMRTLEFYRDRGDYTLLGFIIMPEHIHFICGIPERVDTGFKWVADGLPTYTGASNQGTRSYPRFKNISELVRDIKKYIAKIAVEYISEADKKLLSKFKLVQAAKRKHTYQIWQPDFYDFNIMTEEKLREKLTYTYENPIKKSLCKDVLEYDLSDAHRYFGSGGPKLPGSDGVVRDRFPDVPGDFGSGDPKLPKDRASDRLEIRLAGTGGQGLMLAGLILAEAVALYENKNAVQTQSYGPEARGGSSKSDVVISNGEIYFPKSENPDVLLCLSQEAIEDNACFLKENGLLIVDADLVTEIPKGNWRIYKIPFTRLARERIGKTIVTNILSLGAVVAMTKVVSLDSLKKAVAARVPKGAEELNIKALEEGYKVGLEAIEGGLYGN